MEVSILVWIMAIQLTHRIIIPFSKGHDISSSVGYCFIANKQVLPQPQSWHISNSSHAFPFINRLLLGNSLHR